MHLRSINNMLTSSLKISISEFLGFILFYFRLLTQGSSHPNNLGMPPFFYGTYLYQLNYRQLWVMHGGERDLTNLVAV